MKDPKTILEEWLVRVQANPEIAENIDAVFQVEFRDQPQKIYRIGINNRPFLSEGEGTHDCAISTDCETFSGMADGTVNPQWAFVTGKMSLKGETSKALGIVKLLPE